MSISENLHHFKIDFQAFKGKITSLFRHQKNMRNFLRSSASEKKEFKRGKHNIYLIKATSITFFPKCVMIIQSWARSCQYVQWVEQHSRRMRSTLAREGKIFSYVFLDEKLMSTVFCWWMLFLIYLLEEKKSSKFVLDTPAWDDAPQTNGKQMNVNIFVF